MCVPYICMSPTVICFYSLSGYLDQIAEPEIIAWVAQNQVGQSHDNSLHYRLNYVFFVYQFLYDLWCY